MSSATALSETALPPGYSARWFVMAVVIIADVMDLVDSTVAQLAGPSIRRDIGGSETTLQWILAAYTLTFAVGLITSARLGDIVGRRQMFILGMGGFTAASLACGLAPTATTLIIARVIQGLFGATMIPQGFALVKQSFPEDELQKAFIPFGPIMGLSAVLGPILGGFLIDANVWGSGWRAIFLINVPIGLVGTLIAWLRLPRMPRTPGVRLDPVGSILISIAAGGLIYALVEGRDLGWPTWLYGVVAGAVAVFAVFVWSERRSDHPIIEPSLFTHRGFVAGQVFLNSRARGDVRASVQGLFTFITGAGLLIGNLSAGCVRNWVQGSFVWTFSIAAAVAACAVSRLRMIGEIWAMVMMCSVSCGWAGLSAREV